MDNYLKIDPLFIVFNDEINFNIYLKRSDEYVLYATPLSFTDEHRLKLKNNENINIYINNNEKMTYYQYIEKNLPCILNNPTIPIKEKARLIYDHSLDLTDNMFRIKDGEHFDNTNYEQIKNLVNNIFSFISSSDNSIQTIRNLVSTSYKDYVHSMNTCVYSMSLMLHHSVITDNERPKRSLLKYIGIAAILHDIGKIKIDSEIINKKEKLTNKEFEILQKHPVYGLEIAKYMKLDHMVTNSILFHHEKLDGSGYPTGTKNIPEHIQIITISDIYAAMTCDRPYRKKHSSFEALKYLSKEVNRGRLNKELVKSFIGLISTNQFTI